MRDRHDLLFLGLLYQLTRTGALLMNASCCLNTSTFDDLLDEHDISQYDATTAIELFKKIRIVLH